MAESGFKHKTTFQQQKDESAVTSKTKNKKRNIIWFNSQYSLHVSTNIGKKIFNLGKLFPKTHQYHKLYSRNNISVIYSSLPKFKNVMDGHNKNILSAQGKPSPCNCMEKTSCMLNEISKCKNLVYSCKVSTPNMKENQLHSIGLTEHIFKDRL